MSNIHGLGNSRSNPNNNNRGPRVQRLGQPQQVPSRSQSQADLEDPNGFTMFGNGPSSDGSPLPSVGQLLCPRFKISLKSFIFVVSLIDIIMLIVSFIVNAVDFGTPFDTTNKMLGPSTLTFLKLRAKYTPYIKTGQVDRLLVPVFLHAGIIHLVFNLFFQCNVGFRMEEVWGIPRLAAIYFSAGIGGNLMSALISTTSVSVGASGSLFGILGGMLAFLIGNWNDIPGACMVLF
jgi:membrane associated rhomboid family serine protease